MAILRSIGVVILGYIAVCLVIIPTFMIAKPLQLHESFGGAIVLLAMSCVGGAAGGWVTARLAGRKPRLHAAVLAVLMAVYSMSMAIHPEKDAQGNIAPAWFNWSLVALVVPATMLGALLCRCPKKETLEHTKV